MLQCPSRWIFWQQNIQEKSSISKAFISSQKQGRVSNRVNKLLFLKWFKNRIYAEYFDCSAIRKCQLD